MYNLCTLPDAALPDSTLLYSLELFLAAWGMILLASLEFPAAMVGWLARQGC